MGLCWGRALGSGAEAESVESVGLHIDQTARGALNRLKSLSPVQLVPRTPLCVFPPIRSLLGGALSRLCPPGSPREWGRSGLLLGLVTFASPFHRSPVSGCLRQGGEVTALGPPDVLAPEGTKPGVSQGRSGGAGAARDAGPRPGCLGVGLADAWAVGLEDELLYVVPPPQCFLRKSTLLFLTAL